MENTHHPARLSERLLRAAVLLLLLSRGWQYLYWDGPLRAVLWDEKFFAPYARRLGWTWADWVSSPQAATYIEQTTTALGIGLLLSAVGALLPRRYLRAGGYLLVLGGAICLLHALLTTKAHFGRLGHFIELSLQWMSPLLLLLWLWRPARFAGPAKVAIALTFIGHGLYAWGYYPVPGNFQQMMIDGFGLTNAQALWYLKLAGGLDFLVAALLFVPYRPAVRAALIYIIVWGFLTAAARIYTHLENNSVGDILSFWLSEFGVRGVHFLVPAALFFLGEEEKSQIPF